MVTEYQQLRRIIEIEDRVRLGIRTFPDDAEFLAWCEVRGATARLRSKAHELRERMTATEATR